MRSELGLDLKLCALRSAVGDGGAPARAANIEAYIHRLEEEKRKIEAFRRELPLSVLIISDVISELRDELQKRGGERRSDDGRVMSPSPDGKVVLDGGEEVEVEKNRRDKMNWMSSVQLWTDNNNASKSIEIEKAELSGEGLESEARPNEVFLPFKGILSTVKEESNPATVVTPDLSLIPPSIRSEDNRYVGGGRASLSEVFQTHIPQIRKQRRCWSTELHRRFVLALQQLGGSQVATPKQIREHMKVDGLTNDEVKSHLQKYRLHTRRIPAGSNKHMVVVGGIWTQHDPFSSSQKTGLQSGSPQSPLQLPTSSLAVSLTAGDSYEEEDGKSESYSWKPPSQVLC